MKHLVPVAAIILAAPAYAASGGSAVFDNNCAFCHQAGGVGVPGQFPRLENRVGAMAASPEGRAFLPKIALNGMSGKISVDGEDIIGVMPGFATLSDADLAAVLTYVSRLGKTKAKAFTPKDIAAARALPAMAPGEVAAERTRLAAEKVVP